MSGIVKKFKDCRFETILYEDADGCRILKSKVGEREYGFNADWIPDDKLEWFAQVYSSQLANLSYDTGKYVLKEAQGRYDNFQNFLKGNELGKHVFNIPK